MIKRSERQSGTRHVQLCEPEYRGADRILSIDHRARPCRTAGDRALFVQRIRRTHARSREGCGAPAARPWPSKSAPRSNLPICSKQLKTSASNPISARDALPGISQTLVFTDADGRQIELFAQWQFCTAGRTGAGNRRQQARPHGAVRARSGSHREILFRRSGFSRSPTGSRKTSSSCAAASSTTLSILRAAQTRGCIIWRLNCATPPTCSRPATCSDAERSRCCGDRCVTVPGTTSRPIIAIPTAI